MQTSIVVLLYYFNHHNKNWFVVQIALMFTALPYSFIILILITANESKASHIQGKRFTAAMKIKMDTIVTVN